MTISENLTQIIKNIPSNVKLVAVSKTKPVNDIKEAYDWGQRLFGENKALEMRDKYLVLPKDIQWHFIGHLQSNKVKYIVPFVSMIHSVDSLKLLQEIEKEAKKCNRIVDCLLQISLSDEETKFGMNKQEAEKLLSSDGYLNMKSVNLCGVMGIGSITNNKEQTRKEFSFLTQVFLYLKHKYFSNNNEFKEISMGMSDDFQIAIEEGSTVIRIGSTVFGQRNYNI
ncbi:MAG: YggS family pyridoxal phosphate-dependent enzyme [Bacteroidales bacterium]|jgi:pyridoxal phosphate enzyme (YggS family)|nr:YggS family pyridoxal phosphate-dependent enzyme [Bacteroidales bacterium]